MHLASLSIRLTSSCLMSACPRLPACTACSPAYLLCPDRLSRWPPRTISRTISLLLPVGFLNADIDFHSSIYFSVSSALVWSRLLSSPTLPTSSIHRHSPPPSTQTYAVALPTSVCVRVRWQLQSAGQHSCNDATVRKERMTPTRIGL